MKPHQPIAGGKRLPGEPTLEVTDLTMKESASVLRALIGAVPLVALPWVVSLYLHATTNCDATSNCVMQTTLGLRFMKTLVGTANVPATLVDTPLLADLLVGLLVLCVVYIVCSLFGIPPFGGPAPLLAVKETMQPRTGKAFDFALRDKDRPHRIAIHVTGTYTGFPGDVLVAIRLQLPESRPLEIERTVKPLAEPVKKGEVQEYAFDPINFQFTSPHPGPTHIWIGYGAGPQAKLRIKVQPRV